MRALEWARRLEDAAGVLRRAAATPCQLAEGAGLEVPTEIAAPALADWLNARAAEFAAAASAEGVNTIDPRYVRPWGYDTDAIRADLRTIGFAPCDFWDCLEVETDEVRWRRTWPGGSFESTSRYCARHLAELRAGAAWATADHRVVYIDDAATPADAEAAEPAAVSADPAERELPDAGQVDMLGALVTVEGR